MSFYARSRDQQWPHLCQSFSKRLKPQRQEWNWSKLYSTVVRESRKPSKKSLSPVGVENNPAGYVSQMRVLLESSFKVTDSCKLPSANVWVGNLSASTTLPLNTRFPVTPRSFIKQMGNSSCSLRERRGPVLVLNFLAPCPS